MGDAGARSPGKHAAWTCARGSSSGLVPCGPRWERTRDPAPRTLRARVPVLSTAATPSAQVRVRARARAQRGSVRAAWGGARAPAPAPPLPRPVPHPSPSPGRGPHRARYRGAASPERDPASAPAQPLPSAPSRALRGFVKRRDVGCSVAAGRRAGLLHEGTGNGDAQGGDPIVSAALRGEAVPVPETPGYSEWTVASPP